MIRRLFAIASAISLLLCVASAMVWVRSCWIFDALVDLRYSAPDPAAATADFAPIATQQFTLISFPRGVVLCSRSRRQVGYSGSDDTWHRLIQPTPGPVIGPSLTNRLGFGFHRRRSPVGSSIRLLFPLWAVATLTAVLPVSWLLDLPRRHRLRRLHGGLCPSGT